MVDRVDELKEKITDFVENGKKKLVEKNQVKLNRCYEFLKKGKFWRMVRVGRKLLRIIATEEAALQKYYD